MSGSLGSSATVLEGASGLEGASVSSAHSRRNGAKERFWREAISGQAASGVSIRDYCREHGLSESNFYAWRRELALRDAEASQGKASRCAAPGGKSAQRVSPGPAFAKVRVVEAVPAAEALTAPLAAMEIVFPNALRLQLRGPVEAASLSQVVRVLREAPSC